MEKYARVLVIIFFLTIVNLGLSIFIINKLNKEPEIKQTPIIVTNTNSPTPQSKLATPSATLSDDEIKSDLTLIKAEIRGLRDVLGVTGTFENLSKLIKDLEVNKP